MVVVVALKCLLIVVATGPGPRYLSVPSVDRVLAAHYPSDVVRDRAVRSGDDLALGVLCPCDVGHAHAAHFRSDDIRVQEAHFRCVVAIPVL